MTKPALLTPKNSRAIFIDHGIVWNNPIPVRDLKSFWGALGCSCFAV